MEYLSSSKPINRVEPLVSVCVTTYNHANFIEECLDSILMQNASFPYEVIVGEDDSDDETRSICVEYAKKYTDKIRLFLRSRKDVIYINGLPTGRANFSANLKSARGKYVALIEGDDYWTDKNKLRKQIDFLESAPEYAICFHNARVLYSENRSGSRWSEYQDFYWCHLDRRRTDYTINDLIRSPLCPTASVVFRKPKSFYFPGWFYSVPSGDMALEAMVCGHSKIKYFDEFWSVYRRHPGSVTKSHRGDTIHKGRIKMYLGLLGYFHGDFRQEIRTAIKQHLKEIGDWEIFTLVEKIHLLKVLPRIMISYILKGERLVE